MINGTDQVSVYMSLTREYCLSGDAATVATAMGISLETLSGILEDGDDWEPEESTIAAMAKEADVESEDWDVSEIVEG